MSWLHYLIEANIYLLVFYLCYRLLLANNTHYTLGRVYLILSCVMAFFIPFTQLSVLKPATDTVTQVVTTSTSYVLPANIKPIQTAENRSFEFTADNLLPYLYIGGAIISTIILIIRLSKLFTITKTGTKFDNGHYQRIDLPDSQTAFSFFNYLYVGKDLKQPETIIAHELVHIRQKHTLDIMFLELLKIVNWFSPVVYLMQQSLKTLHEYIADEQTAAIDNDALAYSSFLLNDAYGLQGLAVTHSFFNNNLLKKRIIMLNQKRSSKLARLKYLTAVPLCAGMLCASTLVFSKDYGVIKVGPDKKVIVRAVNDSAKYTLKVTDTRTGNVIISDKMVYTDPETGEKTAYTVNHFSDKKRDALLKKQNFMVEKILRDSAKVDTNPKQQLPPPPPPLAPIKSPFQEFTNYLSTKVKYPESGKKINQNGGVILSFKVNSDGKVSDADVAGRPGETFNEALKKATNQFNGKIKAPAGTYKLNVHYMMLGHEGVKFPAPSVTKDANYVGEINIVGMTDAQRKMLNTPPPPPPAAPKANKILPPPPPPAKSSAKRMGMEQDKSLQAFYTHLAKTVRYPAVAFESDTQGRVILTFDVKDKKISNIKVVRGVTPAINGEAVRALTAFDKPLALPDKKYAMPIAFAIDKGDKQPVIKKEYPAKGYNIVEDGSTPILNEIVIMGYKN